ncbi:MAG: response regulator [Polyangiaceae bacterium]|nr:response regulator [Polyangiaceae bacterium]
MAEVLIIDDDIDSADALAEIMRAEGHHVRVGFDGQEGLRLAGEQIPDVALLDVEMPILSGPGMAYQMFVHDMGLEDVPVVLLSGVTNLKEVAADVGTPYFLGKPYRFEQIVALVGRALSERVAPKRGPTRP